MEAGLSRRIVTAAVLAVTAAACSDSTGPVGKGQTVSLSFSGVRPAGVSAFGPTVAGGDVAAFGDSLVITSGSDRLVITSAEVVVRKIELERVETSVNCDSTTNEDACEEFTIGAMLVSLPLAAGASTELTVAIDSGTYSEVEFKIHKPGNDSVDQAFRAANPTWPQNVSIRVRGTFNGIPFTYTTSLDAEQEVELDPPLVVDASGSATNLTIRLDVSVWFRNGTTGALIDPATANAGGANESLVNDNIKNSIKAFEDQDRDGDERDG